MCSKRMIATQPREDTIKKQQLGYVSYVSEKDTEHFLFYVHPKLTYRKQAPGEISVEYKEELLDCQGAKTLARVIELTCRGSFPREHQVENRSLSVLEGLDI